jgi:O-unit flippase, putative
VSLINNQNAKDIFATLINQMWRLVSGPIIMLLIPLFLTETQQGYWYLFTSLSALSIFADLGFSNIILQFSAHEFAFLSFSKEGLLVGDNTHLNKLASFFKFTIKWIGTIGVVVFPIIYIIGVIYFIRDRVLAVYLLPWTIYAIGSLINFFNTSILSFIEGLNKIEEVQKIRFAVNIVYACIIAIVLVLHGNIFALALGCFISACTIFISLFGKFKKFLSQLLTITKTYTYPWRQEVMPLFIRYALSFSSGYFIFQIYTPLMHYFHGPVLSGKVGISLTLVGAVFNMANIWMYTITPRINMLVSTKNWSTLDTLFLKRLLLAIGTYIIIGIGVVLFIWLFGCVWIIPKVVGRFLPVIPMGILYICYFIQIFVSALALYLRGHKQEPYMVLSIISAVWIACATFILGKWLPADFFFCGFLSMQVLGSPIAYWIFRRCKNIWHNAEVIK